MRVLVLPRDGASPIFYFEPSKAEEERAVRPPIGGGFKGWVARRLAAIRNLEREAPDWVRSPLDWLRSRLPADERLLMALRTAPAIELIHPSTLPAESALASWTAMLDNRFRWRLGLLVAYLILLVPTTLLTLLPGPNVLGIWVAYRLIAHAMALLGIVRTLRGRPALTLRTAAVLDGPVTINRLEARRVQAHFRLRGLVLRLKRDRVMAKLDVRRRKRAEAELETTTNDVAHAP